MEYKEIKKLIDDMGDSKLNFLEIEFPEGMKISMKKDIPVGKKEVKEEKVVYHVEAEENKAEEKVTEHTEVSHSDNIYKEIKSPMVGTFYASPSPDKEPFVKVGDIVKKGQTLCVLEAMKLMNEIESEYDGKIVEICVNNEDMVEYGTTLFKIES